MGDVTVAPNAGTVLLLKVASGQVPVSLLKYAALHKQASVGDVLKAVGTAAKSVGRYAVGHPSQTFIAASLVAPAAVRAGTKRVVQPVAEGVGDSLKTIIDKPAEALKENTDKVVDNLGHNAQALGNTAKTIITPIKDALIESAKESGSSFGNAFTAAAIPGMGALAGAGLGGITGSALGAEIFKGSKEESKRKRRMMTLLLAGIGGVGGLVGAKKLQDNKVL